MPNSIYTKTKNEMLDARSDKQEERDQHLKAGKQAKIAGAHDAATKHTQEAGVIDAGIAASTPVFEEGIKIVDIAEAISTAIPANKPPKNAGMPGYTKSGNGGIL